MQKYILITSTFTAVALLTVTGCFSNQAVKTTDGKMVVTDGKPQVDDDTGLVPYKNAQTGKTEQINRNQAKDMSELDNQYILHPSNCPSVGYAHSPWSPTLVSFWGSVPLPL